MTKFKVYNAEPAPELIRIIEEDCNKSQGLVSEIIIGKNLGLDALGCFNPTNKVVILDLESIVQENGWRKDGILLIPSAWYACLFTWWHELTHAYQVAMNPSIAKFVKLPSVYEESAHSVAYERLLDYLDKGHNLPKLSDMGYIGERMNTTINMLYHNHPSIARGVDIAYAGGVMHVEALHTVGDFSVKQIQTLCQLIDAGDKHLGIKVDNNYYASGETAYNLYYEQYENAE